MEAPDNEASSGLQAIRRSALRSLRRFPGVLLAAALATGLFIHGALSPGSGGEFPHWAALLVALLGISWIYGLGMALERRLQAPWKTLLPLLIGAISLGLYYWRIRGLAESAYPMAFVLEFAGLVLASHFFAAYAPFLGFQQPRAFWEYNRAIFLRFLLALLFSATLMAGIALFFTVLSRIIPGVSLEILAFIFLALVGGLFNTWFFLAGVPEDFEALELRPRPYPRGLKFFAQYVLLTLVTAIGILLAIWILQSLASGHRLEVGVAASFLAMGGFGLLAYLLLYPLELDPQERSLRIFSKGFFLGLTPFLAILAYFSFRLLWNFGWTPPRYYGLILTLWGLALSLYLAIARQPRISWIPVSLSLIALLTAAGPWSATALNRTSQNRRMATLLGKPGPVDQAFLSALSAADRAKIERQASYLEQNFGCEELKPYFGGLLRPRHQEAATCSTMDLFYLLRRDAKLPPQDLEAEVVNINFMEKSEPGALNTKGYDSYFPSSAIRFLDPGQAASDCPKGESAEPICVRRSAESYQVEIFRQGQNLGRIDTEPMVQALLKKHESAKPNPGEDSHYRDFYLPRPELSFETRLGGRPARLDVEHFRLERRGARVSPEELRFSLLFQE